MLVSGYPSDVVGAPFARPIWWNTKLPASREFHVTAGGVSFEWEKLPPAIFSLNGQVKADAKKEVKIYWQTPQKK